MPIRYDLYLARRLPPMARYIEGDDSDGRKADLDANPACLGWTDNDEKLGLISILAYRFSNALHAFSGSGILSLRQKQPSIYC